jgi:hypothetical protein
VGIVKKVRAGDRGDRKEEEEGEKAEARTRHVTWSVFLFQFAFMFFGHAGGVPF